MTMIWTEVISIEERIGRPHANLSAQQWVEMVANLAGNAWSLWHYGPWKLALLATVGQFHKKEPQEVPQKSAALESANAVEPSSETESGTYSSDSGSD
mmetsp:Transcript_102358/g.203216  ORF Transcript_102358/g.203216 Transcript_102358/m.203216 type:complete len:98 (-) Transcript_102358:55-348(-)